MTHANGRSNRVWRRRHAASEQLKKCRRLAVSECPGITRGVVGRTRARQLYGRSTAEQRVVVFPLPLRAGRRVRPIPRKRPPRQPELRPSGGRGATPRPGPPPHLQLCVVFPASEWDASLTPYYWAPASPGVWPPVPPAGAGRRFFGASGPPRGRHAGTPWPRRAVWLGLCCDGRPRITPRGGGGVIGRIPPRVISFVKIPRG